MNMNFNPILTQNYLSKDIVKPGILNFHPTNIKTAFCCVLQDIYPCSIVSSLSSILVNFEMNNLSNMTKTFSYKLICPLFASLYWETIYCCNNVLALEKRIFSLLYQPEFLNLKQPARTESFGGHSPGLTGLRRKPGVKHPHSTRVRDVGMIHRRLVIFWE